MSYHALPNRRLPSPLTTRYPSNCFHRTSDLQSRKRLHHAPNVKSRPTTVDRSASGGCARRITTTRQISYLATHHALHFHIIFHATPGTKLRNLLSFQRFITSSPCRFINRIFLVFFLRPSKRCANTKSPYANHRSTTIQRRCARRSCIYTRRPLVLPEIYPNFRPFVGSHRPSCAGPLVGRAPPDVVGTAANRIGISGVHMPGPTLARVGVGAVNGSSA